MIRSIDKKFLRIISFLFPSVLLAIHVSLPLINSTIPDLPKVESQVLDELQDRGRTDFLIWMRERADLINAQNITLRSEKRQYVYNTLLETAVRTQEDLLNFLNDRDISYRSYYIANKVLVYQGDLDLISKISTRLDVEKITANHIYHALDPLPMDVGIDQPDVIEPNLIFVNADDVWSMGITGQGIVVAGNDTGIDETHPALMSHYRGCIDPPTCSNWDHNYNWWDATETYPIDPYDGHNHGTFTSGIMVGDDGGSNQIGMAPGAQMIHCKMLTDDGSTSDAMIIECFEWELAPWDLNHQNPDPLMAPDTINNAWGVYSGGQNQFRDEIQALQAAGTVVAFATGGEGPGCSSLRSPADYHEVLTVGGVDQTGGVLPGMLMSFSAKGPSVLDPSPPYYFPDVIAPGINIRSSVNNPTQGYQIWSGTSAAVSHAPGLVALCWSASPGLIGDVYTTIQIINDSAYPLTGQYGSNCGGDYNVGPNNDWGFGTIDALATVNNCVTAGLSGALHGFIYDALSESPLEFASVSAASDQGMTWQALTDSNGYYTVTLPTDIYTVTAEYPLYTTGITTEVVITTDQATLVDFYLVPQGRLFGYVTDFETGLPINANIRANGILTETNPADGYYEIYLDQGLYDIHASSIGYVTQTQTISLTGGSNFQLDFELIPVSLPVTPTASFISNSPVILGARAVFTNTSNPGNPPDLDYLWEFGDSFTSTLENPSHIYSHTKVYSVTLDICNPIGCDSMLDIFEVLDQPEADLSIDKKDLIDPLIIGNNLYYIITISNNGPDDAKNITILDTPEYSFSLVTASEGCMEDDLTINCQYPGLNPGENFVIVLVVQAQVGPGVLMNKVEVTSDIVDPNLDNNVDSESTLVQVESIFDLHIPFIIK